MKYDSRYVFNLILASNRIPLKYLRAEEIEVKYLFVSAFSNKLVLVYTSI